MIFQNVPTIRGAIFLWGMLGGVFGSTLFAQQLRMQATRVSSGLDQPVFATTAPGDPNRLFVIEQTTGNIQIVDPATGVKNSTPFLTINDLTSGGERGLLGMAFHPNYASNGRFYVNMTGAGGATIIREYQRGTDDIADPESANTIMTFAQPFTNHNGGWIGFGPEGYLHIATGDGGSGNDPDNNAQDITENLLGKILRIDVDSDGFPNDPDRDYGIPASNPFVGVAGDDEILHYGLRNPWRSSFDRQTGDLYIGDVGQRSREEIDVASAGATGVNYGWRLREGLIQTPAIGVGGPKPDGAVDPIYEFAHGGGANQGNSVTGGYVYRGPVAALQGHYLFGDFANQRIWSLRWDKSSMATFDGTNYTRFSDWTDIIETDQGSVGNVSSFGEDEEGNLYIVDYDGEIFRIDSAEFVSCDLITPAMESSGCDIADMDKLYDSLGSISAMYDLNADGIVDSHDIAPWLQQASSVDNPLKRNPGDVYVVGDVNLDGQVDSTDLGRLLNHFNTTAVLDWGSGNLNADAVIDSADLGLLLNNFSFTSSVAMVPEPTACVWLISMVLLASCRPRRLSRR